MSVQHSIEELTHSRVRNDPQLMSKAKRLEELKLKPSEIEGEIRKLEAELVEKEKNIAKQVLDGGAAAVSGLSKITEKIADLRKEGEIYHKVIEEAQAEYEELKSKLEEERTQKCRQALRDAFVDVVEFLQHGNERLEVLKQAVHLAQQFHLVDEIQQLERIIRSWSAKVEARS